MACVLCHRGKLKIICYFLVSFDKKQTLMAEFNKVKYYGTGNRNESSSIANPRYVVFYQGS